MAPSRQASTHYIHRISYSTQEKLVGAFVLLAILIFFALFILNSHQFHLFDDPLRFKLQVNTAEGISRDTPVRISGIQVGRVDRIEITEDHSVLLHARVHGQYKSLVRTDSIASIGKLSLLGRSSIEITPGSPDQPAIEDGRFLPVEEPLSIDALLAQFEPVLQGVEEIVQNLAQTTGAVQPQVIEALLANLLQTSADVQAITAQVAAGQGPVGSLLYDVAIERQMSKLVTGLEQTLAVTQARIEQLEPTLAKLEDISQEGHRAITELPAMMQEAHLLLRQVNTTLSGVNQEMTHLPDMIQRLDLMMDQTDVLLDRLSNTWPLSRGGREALPQLIEAAPHD